MALKLKDKLSSAGHYTEIIQLKIDGTLQPGAKDVKLQSIPDTVRYDSLVLGSPVHGFSLCAAMKTYLTQISSLKDMEVSLFITHSFPFSWMGGNRPLNSRYRTRKTSKRKGALS